ncbi:hypothetical protein M422DRAFT_29517, partial [Sphaerobolus stellatus SS14]
MSSAVSTQEISQMEDSIRRIPPVFLAQMKQQARIGARDVSSLSFEEKCRLYQVYKKTLQSLKSEGLF